MFGEVKEYILNNDLYSNDHLKSIVFVDNNDAKIFSELLILQPNTIKENMGNVELYDYSYIPLTSEDNYNSFKKLLESNEGLLFDDLDFLAYLLKSLPQALANKNEAIGKLAKSSHPATLYFAIKNNDLPTIKYMANSISDSLFFDILTTECPNFCYGSPLELSVEKGDNNIATIILDKLEKNKDQLSKIAKLLTTKSSINNKIVIQLAAKNGHINLLKLLAKKFGFS